MQKKKVLKKGHVFFLNIMMDNVGKKNNCTIIIYVLVENVIAIFIGISVMFDI